MNHYTKRIAEHSPALAESKLSQCRHEIVWRAGWPDGKQRLRCSFCNKTFMAKPIYRDPLTILRTLGPLFLVESPIKRTQRITGLSRQTIRKYFGVLRDFQEKRAA